MSIEIAPLEAFLAPLTNYAGQCHDASIKLVRSGLLPGSRVARGWAKGVGSQHSWVVVGPDCYDPQAVIVDPTLWSYTGQPPAIWVGSAKDKIHTPHNGEGNIWTWGRPTEPTGKLIELTPATPLSQKALSFLATLGPLDAQGWMTLMKAPVRGWPAAEIVAAMDDTSALKVFIPIDLLGMLTDRNPGGLYLP
jgi:hypothetical protein